MKHFSSEDITFSHLFLSFFLTTNSKPLPFFLSLSHTSHLVTIPIVGSGGVRSAKKRGDFDLFFFSPALAPSFPYPPVARTHATQLSYLNIEMCIVKSDLFFFFWFGCLLPYPTPYPFRRPFFPFSSFATFGGIFPGGSERPRENRIDPRERGGGDVQCHKGKYRISGGSSVIGGAR